MPYSTEYFDNPSDGEESLVVCYDNEEEYVPEQSLENEKERRRK